MTLAERSDSKKRKKLLNKALKYTKYVRWPPLASHDAVCDITAYLVELEKQFTLMQKLLENQGTFLDSFRDAMKEAKRLKIR